MVGQFMEFSVREGKQIKQSKNTELFSLFFFFIAYNIFPSTPEFPLC